MRQKKYMMSKGLAFSEEKDLRKLRKQSLKGWHVKSFKFMGYGLERGEKENVIYSIDFRPLEESEQEEYFELFTSAGWSHICSDNGFHLFKANTGTQPIYSEAETTIDKISRMEKPVFAITSMIVPIAIVLGILFSQSNGMIETISRWTFMGSVVIAGPAIMTSAAIAYQKWKVRREGDASLKKKSIGKKPTACAVGFYCYIFRFTFVITSLLFGMLGMLVIL